MQVKVHAAKTQLSQLIEAALRGEDVVIARGDKPVVRLVPVKQTSFSFGLLAKELPDPLPDFLEPMAEEELRLWEGVREKRSS
jgi:prevent-host-death family protein